MFRRVSARVSAAIAVSSLAFMLVSTVPAYANANPHNRGHHYGQLKNGNHGHHYGQRKHHPGPVPPPKPAPKPAPKPVSGSIPPIVHKSVTETIRIPALDPTQTSLQPVNQVVANLPKMPPGNPIWWLILTILPTLAVIVFIAARGLVLSARRRPASAPAPVAQPAAS